MGGASEKSPRSMYSSRENGTGREPGLPTSSGQDGASSHSTLSAGQSVIKEALDKDGRARVDVGEPGICMVNFPNRNATDWWPIRTSKQAQPEPLCVSGSAPSKSCSPPKFITICLYDAQGNPVQDEDVELTNPDEDEDPVQTKTDKDGKAHVEKITPGKWEVNFPKRGFDEWHRIRMPDKPVTWIEIVLLDANGKPIPNEPFEVTLLGDSSASSSTAGT